MDDIEFEMGEVYIFSKDNPECPADETALWGKYSDHINGEIELETYSTDLREFFLWKMIPPGYKYCRLSTRRELQDYVSAEMVILTEKRLSKHIGGF